MPYPLLITGTSPGVTCATNGGDTIDSAGNIFLSERK